MRTITPLRCTGGSLLAAGLVLGAMAQTAPAPALSAGNLEAYEQFGSTAARSAGIADLNWTEAQFEAFVAGLRAAHEKRPVPMTEAGRHLLAGMQRRVAEVRAREKAEQDSQMKRFTDQVRSRSGMQKKDSGLLARIIMPGTGPRPQGDDTVVADLHANMPDGRTPIPALSGQNITVRLSELPPGVAEALQMLALEGHGVFMIPPHLSFGTGQWPEGLAPGTPILLQIDLKDILPAGEAK